MKKNVKVQAFFGCVFFTIILALFIPDISWGKRFISIGTGPTAGTYYPMGGGMAKILNDKMKDVEATATVTGASVHNCMMVGKKELEMGMTTSDIAFKALNGEKPFKEPLPVRVLFGMFASEMQIVAKEASGIKKMEDLKGKRVSIGAVGGGCAILAEIIMREYDIYKDVKIQYLDFGQSTMAIRDANLDAAFVYAPSPATAIIDLASTDKITFIPILPEMMKKITEKYAYFKPGVLKAGTYKGLDRDVPMIIVLSIMVVHKDMDEKLANEITKAIFESIDYLRTVHPVGRQMTIENAVRVPIPLHPGAERYFKEMGVLK